MNKYRTTSAICEDLGKLIKYYRIAFPLTQQELADASGVSLRCISKMEAGGDVQLSNFIKVLRALKLENNLYSLIPDQSKRPSLYTDNMHIKQRVRKKQTDTGNTFKWGDEL